MWLDIIIQRKAELKISAKEMAKRSRIGLSERTINRILTRESKCPGIESVIDTAETVGLTPHDIFADSSFVIADKSAAELQKKIDDLKEERDRLVAENAVLIEKNVFLTEKVSSLKDEIIETHHYYIRKLNGQ